MGLSSSKQRPPDVDLLPPKFDTRAPPLSRLPASPFEYLFGQEARDKLLHNYFPRPNSLALGASLIPDAEGRTVVGVAADFGRRGAVELDRSAVTLAYGDPAGVSSSSDTLWQSTARLGTDGSLRFAAAGLHLPSGLGGYASLPLDYFLEGKAAAAAAGAVGARGRRASVGHGLAGPAVRLTHPTCDSSTYKNNKHEAAGSIAHMQPPSPSSLTAPPADASGSGLHAGAASTVTGSARGAVVAVPEVGLRYIGSTSPFSDTTYSLGLHAAPVAPYPLKLWAVGSYDGGVVTGGLQVSTAGARWADKAGGLFGGAAAGTAATATAAAAPPALTSGPASLLGGRLDLDAAVCVASPAQFEASLALDGARKEVVAGYVSSLTVRREVYNPFEARNVRGIYNYADVGFEFRRSLLAPFPTALGVGASWQLNKNWLFKVRAGSRDAAASVAFKSWLDPWVTLCASVTLDRVRQEKGVGLSVTIEKGGAVDYQKAAAGSQRSTPLLRVRATPALGERMSRHVDEAPFAPARGHGGDWAGGAPGLVTESSAGTVRVGGTAADRVVSTPLL